MLQSSQNSVLTSLYFLGAKEDLCAQDLVLKIFPNFEPLTLTNWEIEFFSNILENLSQEINANNHVKVEALC